MLNSQQIKAIDTIEGPVLVVAGPGTGKTKILTERVANILKKTDAYPDNILCITFTETAAVNMRRRLVQRIGPVGHRVHISTFHSFCNQIINERPAVFQKQKQLRQIDDLTQKRILDTILLKFPQDLLPHGHLFSNSDKTFYRPYLKTLIESLKKDAISPSDAIEKASKILEEARKNPIVSTRDQTKFTEKHNKELKKKEKFIEAMYVYKMYDDTLKAEGYYDYNDMILWVIEAFEKDEELLRDYQEKYQYILVDEYQDTSGSQNKLLFLLGKNHPENRPNIFVVGDDDQSIFRFQGANVWNLLEFQQKFNPEVITVDINYRSNQRILEIADNLINHNRERLTNHIPNIKKKLKSGRYVEDGGAHIVEVVDDETEVLFVVEKIKELIKQGTPPDEIAVLYRNHDHANQLIESLVKHKVPINLQRGRNALDEPLINGFVSLLRVVRAKYSPDFDSIFLKAISQPYFEIDPLEIFRISISTSKKDYDRKSQKTYTIYERLAQNDPKLPLGFNESKRLREVIRKISEWRKFSYNNIAFLVAQKIAEESGFLKYVFEMNNSISLEDLSSVQSFFDFIKVRNILNKNMTLDNLVEDIDEMIESGLAIEERNLNTDKPGVNLMTIHSSKGLEFDVVFIIRTTSDVWKEKNVSNAISIPSEFLNYQRTYEGDDFEEIRRLFFVGITRAKKSIYFTYAKVYRDYEEEKSSVPAQFLFEVNTELLKKVEINEIPKITVETVKMSLQPVPRDEFKLQEEEFLRSLLRNYKLTPTDLNEYLKCPLNFKMNQIYKVPSINYKDSLYSILGTAVHKGLEKAFERGGNWLEVAKQEFENKLLDELLLKSDFEQLKKIGFDMIERFFDSGENFANTFVVEKFIGYDNSVLIQTENFKSIPICGKIDRIDLINVSGSTSLVKVIDYKASSKKSINAILGKTKSQNDKSLMRQMVFYKLLCENSPFFLIKGKKVKVLEAEFIFLKNSIDRVSFSITDEMVYETIQDIESAFSGIMDLDFNGSDKHPLCGDCEWCKTKKNNNICNT
ncbi:ATP-dependent helicase [Candidatus Dojkabacteria bacterium]|uniref:DNA 3'-5' helicase n=1 Tax=Candidatus Dojkabacteria bacterium TaxID=2099670 RepID=A0A3M0Z1Q5_9BACT|nr:MAG: ATP-dependent helicase [Candidatus Dojkabacteria bacterium]